jgi:hypothetical protein
MMLAVFFCEIKSQIQPNAQCLRFFPSFIIIFKQLVFASLLKLVVNSPFLWNSDPNGSS